MSGLLLGLLFPGLICLVFISRAYGEIDEKFIAEWAQAHALALTPVNRPMVWWYLRNARVLRTIGVLAGLFFAPLVGAAVGFKAGNNSIVFAFVGYLLGALYAEVAMTRPRSGRASASLIPRELTDYISPGLLRAQRTVAALTLVAALVMLRLGYRTDLGRMPEPLLVVMAVVVVVGAMALEALQRWVVQRPQPVMEPELLAADDAIRSQAVHSLSGSGLALELLALSYVCLNLQDTDVSFFRWVMWVPGLLGFFAAIGVCLYYGHRAWRVQRPITAVPPRSA